MNSERKNVGVTQKAVVFRGDGKFLTIRRSKTAPHHPLAWDLPGGQLEYGEEPTFGITREIREEAGLEVSGVKPFDVSSHDHGALGFWVTITYRAKAESVEVKLSYEHDNYQWVTKEEFMKLKSWPKIINFVSNY